MNALLAWVIGLPLALFVANWGEWIIHKRVLHLRGKRKGNFWNFHWYEHHNESRKHGMPDPAYQSASLLEWNSRTKELAALSTGLFIWIPVLVLSPAFGQAIAVGFLYSTANYYYKHRRAHLDPEWARAHLPWHVDHHLGPNQDANWCVTRPWWDWIMGTREKYVGTERDLADQSRRSRKASPVGVARVESLSESPHHP